MKYSKSILFLLILVLFASSLAHAADARWMNGYARRVVQEVNAERARRGLNELEVDPGLCAAAEIRAREIAKKFSHTRPDGSKWRTVSPDARGENIARGQKSVDKVMAAWMSSSGHRANILRGSYGSMGAACVKIGNIYYWVQLFGR